MGWRPERGGGGWGGGGARGSPVLLEPPGKDQREIYLSKTCFADRQRQQFKK